MSSVLCAAALPGSSLVVTGYASGALRLQTRLGNVMGSVTVGSLDDSGAVTASPVCSVACLWDGSRVVVGCDNGTVSMYRVVDLESFEYDKDLTRTALPPRALAVAADNSLV